MELTVNLYKPDFQPENIIYFSKIRFKSYKKRLFKICNIALRTAIQYSRFLEENKNNKKSKSYSIWKNFLDEYFHCTLNKFKAEDLEKQNLLGYCQWSNVNEVYPKIYLRYFNKKFEYVFWHELAHLILHSKKEIYDYISHDLREFEADFFVYCFNFFFKDIQDKYSFDFLLSKIRNVSNRDIKNYNIYCTFLENYSNNNVNFMGYRKDLVNEVFYENKNIKHQ